MAKNEIEKYDFESLNLIDYIIKRFKLFVIVGLVAFIGSAIVSLLITPKYKSEVTMFPTASGSLSQTLLSMNTAGRAGILAFGEEEETERILQILNSDFIRDRIIESYNLVSHYEIDPDAKFARTLVYQAFNSNVDFKRTAYMAIEISVLDEDPVMAANIANDIAALVDTAINNMRRKRAQSALELVTQEYQRVDSMETFYRDSMNILREMGVHDYERSVERLTEGYANALIDNNRGAVGQIQERIDLYSQYGDNYVNVREHLYMWRDRKRDLQTKVSEAELEAKQALSHTYIIDSAYPAEKKAYPVRSLIVIISTFSAVFISLIISLLYDRVRKNS